MPRFSDPLPRTPVSDLIEDLREAAEVAIIGTDIPAHETSEAEGAQTLAEFHAALTEIAEGAQDPQEIARKALSLDTPMKPLDGRDPIRRLLDPDD